MARNLVPPSSNKNKMAERELAMFLDERCLRAGVSLRGPFNIRIVKLLGRPMTRDAAWDWLVTEYEKANPKKLLVVKSRHVNRAPTTVGEVADKINDGDFATLAARRVRVRSTASFYATPAWRALRYEVLAESDGRCALCGRSKREHGTTLHVDHIKPRSLFPALELEKSNTQVLCEDCNMGKGNRDDRDWNRPESSVGEIVAGVDGAKNS